MKETHQGKAGQPAACTAVPEEGGGVGEGAGVGREACRLEAGLELPVLPWASHLSSLC